jgi:hypothetical protein
VSVQIGLRSTTDAEELQHIFRRIFGETKASARERSWAWQYERNPQSPHGPVVYVARRDSRPLGQMGTMPVSLWWGGREVRASWGIDYFVNPDAEGEGHSIALAKAWMRDVDVALALGLAHTSYLICLRLGFRDLGYVPFFHAILDPAAIVRRRYGRLPGTLARPLAALVGWRARRRQPLSTEIAVTSASSIGAEYDALWERARESYDACVRRDAAYVRWRYQEAPNKSYAIREARRGGVLTGFAVTRHEELRGIRLGWIVDLFAMSDDHLTRDALLTDAMRSFAEAGVARVQVLCTSVALASALPRHGFFKGTAAGHLCARPNGIPDLPSTASGRWHVVFGDGDWDR